MARNNVGSYKCSIGLLIFNLLFSLGELAFYIFAVIGLENEHFIFRDPGSVVLASITSTIIFVVICFHLVILVMFMIRQDQLHSIHMFILVIFPMIHVPQVILTIFTMVGICQGFIRYTPEGFLDGPVHPPDAGHDDLSSKNWDEHNQKLFEKEQTMDKIRMQYKTYHVWILVLYTLTYFSFSAYSVFSWTLFHRFYKDLRRKALINATLNKDFHVKPIPRVEHHSWGKILPQSLRKKFELPEESAAVDRKTDQKT